MAEKLLYKPEELKPMPFFRQGDSWIAGISGHELLKRTEELGAVEGEEEFKLIWENRGSIPEDWLRYRDVLVLDAHAGLVRVLQWNSRDKCWLHGNITLGSRFYDDSCLLCPRCSCERLGIGV